MQFVNCRIRRETSVAAATEGDPSLIESNCALAFVKEDFGMLAPLRCPALTILADQNSESDTRSPIALVAVLAQDQHAIGQLVTHCAGSRRRSIGDGGWIAVLWCNYHPGAIGAAHITTVLVKVVAERSLAFGLAGLSTT